LTFGDIEMGLPVMIFNVKLPDFKPLHLPAIHGLPGCNLSISSIQSLREDRSVSRDWVTIVDCGTGEGKGKLHRATVEALRAHILYFI
jgi:hypothetical protein